LTGTEPLFGTHRYQRQRFTWIFTMQLILSAGAILAIVLWGLLSPTSLSAVFDQALAFITHDFGWLYLWVVLALAMPNSRNFFCSERIFGTGSPLQAMLPAVNGSPNSAVNMSTPRPTRRPTGFIEASRS
jgi:hypothetical protein